MTFNKPNLSGIQILKVYGVDFHEQNTDKWSWIELTKSAHNKNFLHETL
jgi:hypothetical protein